MNQFLTHYKIQFNNILILFLCIFFLQCKNQNKSIKETSETKKVRQDSLIEKYVTNCAKTYNYRFEMQEWQKCLNQGLKIDSTVAYFWQQKAMPYFKAKKYEVGMEYLNKAVMYNSERWLSYRAFIKCIFSKTYKDAIKDFEKCIETEGNSYVMDHTYKFHIALCNLQLNKYKKAEEIFKIDIEEQEEEWGEAHFIDLFYYGISKYEQNKWEEAIAIFDKSLSSYPNFSDVEYYKSICLLRLNKIEEFRTLYAKAKLDGEMGNTISEDNSIYETYPYQVRW
jgi:tetratricopeptide (TPR) repeat protein